MRVVMALSAVLLSAGLAQAASPVPKGPCGEDIEKLCKVKGKETSEKIPDCLRRNEAKLSEGCRKGLVPTAEQAAKAPKVPKIPKSEGLCGADIDKFCGDQGKKIPECLKRNEAKLSAACREEMSKPFAAPSKPKGPCGEFVEQLCKERTPAKIGECLKLNESKVSPACREEMNKPFTPPSQPKGACGEYVNRFCKEKEPGQIGECLKLNEAKLSPACREEMRKPFAKTAKPAGACGAYVEKFCRGDNPLPIEICLRHNIKKVSAACKAEMDKRQDGPSR